MGISDKGPTFSDFARLIKVAVLSAREQTSLRPHLLYDGSPNELTQWLGQQGVPVIKCRSRFARRLWWIQKRRRMSNAYRVGTGASLRAELPPLYKQHRIEEPFVLYTDCDVLFVGDPVPDLLKLQPALYAAADENAPGQPRRINTGVMLMNLPAMLKHEKQFTRFTRSGLKAFCQGAYDQDAYNEFYPSEQVHQLPTEMNWRGYWGMNPKASIVHFHGLKPFHRPQLGQQQLPQFLADMGTDAFHAYCKQWDHYAAQI
ncbi:MAG: hypothetical protein ACOCVG_04665 [Verrucomicrobiota bacterium]